MNQITYTPIGFIRSPFREPIGTPLQAVGARGVRGVIKLDPLYAAGLQDIEGFSHLTILYHLHRCRGYALQVTPFLDDQIHGVFATRAPARPNAIGMSVVRLVSVDAAGCTLTIKDVDMVDGTPLLDIKPYIPAFDDRMARSIGWYDKHVGNDTAICADGRFQ